MNFKHFVSFQIGILFVAKLVTGANILFYFASVNFSQKNSAWPLVLALAKNGHNVTFLSPQINSPTPHQNISDLAPILLQDMVSPLYNVDRFAQREASLEKNFDYVAVTTSICKSIITNRNSDPTLAKLFDSGTTFDLVVVNSLLSECGFFIAKYFKAKTIHYSPCTMHPFFYETYGISNEAAWIPDFVHKFDNIPMTFVDRVYNAHMPMYWQWVRNSQLSPALEETVKPLLKMDLVPTLYELEMNVSVVLLNTHVAADFARTQSPFLVDIGGMTSWEKEKELPKKFKEFLDLYKTHGVVLITFGSTVLLNTVSERHQTMFFDMVNSFPQVGFMMRWSGPLPKFIQKQPKNLMVSEWLPQKEILRHPNCRSFISHGGISSIHEATFYGVPMIVLPLFSDQDFNAYRIETQEVGLRVEIRGMSGQTLVTALDKILSDNRFRQNMIAKSAIFRDRPQNPIDTALFWTEFSLRHNNTISTLLPENQHLNAFQIRLLDVYLFDLSILILILMLIKYGFTIFMKILLGMLRKKELINNKKSGKLD